MENNIDLAIKLDRFLKESSRLIHDSVELAITEGRQIVCITGITDGYDLDQIDSVNLLELVYIEAKRYGHPRLSSTLDDKSLIIKLNTSSKGRSMVKLLEDK